jgi:aryl-alcohol dehydrogenase-like predicted oxidoreductase
VVVATKGGLRPTADGRVERDASPVSRLAVAWTLANPAVHVAIVGTRNPNHVDVAIAAADLVLGDPVLRRIDGIVNDEVPVGGPTPESV